MGHDPARLGTFLRGRTIIKCLLKAEIEGTKEEIVVCQERHEQLTTLSQKAERLCLQRKNQIKRTSAQVEEAKLELNKVHESHLKTVETLKMTESQAQEVEKELLEARVCVTKLTDIKRQLSEENLQLDREQAAADKSSTNAMKKIKELREKTKSLEDSLIDTNNNTSTAMEEIMAKAAVVDHQDEDIRYYEDEIDGSTKLLEQIGKSLKNVAFEFFKFGILHQFFKNYFYRIKIDLSGKPD